MKLYKRSLRMIPHSSGSSNHANNLFKGNQLILFGLHSFAAYTPLSRELQASLLLIVHSLIHSGIRCDVQTIDVIFFFSITLFFFKLYSPPSFVIIELHDWKNYKKHFTIYREIHQTYEKKKIACKSRASSSKVACRAFQRQLQ